MKHYGHLLTDYLGPIAFAIGRGYISRDAPVTFVRAVEDNPVSIAFAEGMRRLGLASQVVELGRGDSAEAESYLHAEALASSGEHRYAMAEVTPLMHEIFAAAYADRPEPAPGGKRVYLTRGSAKLRQVEGEEELIGLLRERGFHIFESRWDNHPEQLRVFSEYDVLLGVHGAGLANVIFAKPQSRLVEIFAGDARKTTGLFWASCAGADYTPLFGGNEGDRQSFAIDPKALVRELDAWLD
jgi:capsular polysaccharide biosynthesis protein